RPWALPRWSDYWPRWAAPVWRVSSARGRSCCCPPYAPRSPRCSAASGGGLACQPGEARRDDCLGLVDDLADDLGGRFQVRDQAGGLAGAQGVFLRVVAAAGLVERGPDLVA